MIRLMIKMVVADGDEKYKKDGVHESEVDDLKKSAVEVRNVDHTAARFIASHLLYCSFQKVF